MAHIKKVEIDNNSYLIEPTLYIAPSLDSDNGIYNASLTDFTLDTGVTIQVQFTTTNPAGAQLKINNDNAKDIYYEGSVITANLFKSGHTYTLVYDGTKWQLVGDIDTNTTYTNGTGLNLNLNNGEFSVKYGNEAGTAVQGNDTRLSDARTPTSHSHGNITNDGRVGTGNALLKTVGGVISTGPSIGTDDTKFLNNKGEWAVPAYTTNTDEKVKQTPTTTDADYELLFSESTNNSQLTEGSRKTNTLKYNPSTKILTIDGGTLTGTNYSGKAATAGTADSANAVALNNVSGADDLKAIEALSETSGFLKKTAANTWTLDANTYLTSHGPSYGKITVSAQSSETTALASQSSATTPTAQNANETLKFTTANKWIVATGTNSSTAGNDEIKIAHALSDVTANSYGDSSNQTPDYGETFKVPYITVDAAGHITAISTHTVKIPASDNSNTTYTISTGTENGKIKVTPSSETAYEVSVYGLGDRAFDSTAYLPLTGGTMTGNINLETEEVVTADIALANSGTKIVQILRNTQNWGLALGWNNKTPYTETYIPGIGFNNTKQLISIVPYATNTAPWGRAVGLSIGATDMKFEDNVVAHSGNVSTGDSNGQIKIAGVNVTVKNISDLAYIAKGSGSTKFLREDGTWQTALTAHQDLSAYAKLASPTFTGTPKSETPSPSSDSKMIATKEYVDGILAANDALVYKGTKAGASTTTNGGTLMPAGVQGDTYKVSTAGYINGQYCEVGDMIICVTDVAASTTSNYTTTRESWNIIQTSDGTVSTSETSVTENTIPRYSGATGKFIKKTSVSIDNNNNISTTGEYIENAGGRIQKVTLLPAGAWSGYAADTWYRCCKITSKYHYTNFIIQFSGQWSTGVPTIATVSIQQRNTLWNITLLHCAYVGNIKSMRLVSDNGIWLEVQLTMCSSGSMGAQTATFIGNVLVSDINATATPTPGTFSAIATLDFITKYNSNTTYNTSEDIELTGTITGNTGTGLTIQSANTGNWKEGVRIIDASNNYAVMCLCNSTCTDLVSLVHNGSTHKYYFDVKRSDGDNATINIPTGHNGTFALTDGHGASGTWDIDISGTAAMATGDTDGNAINTTYVKLDGSNNMTGNLSIIAGDTDKFVNFWYDTNKKAGASWRIGMLGSGDNNTNYFVIQSGTSTTSATTWNNTIRIGQNNYDVALSGQLNISYAAGINSTNGILNLTSSAEASVVKNGTWQHGINHVVTNLATGGHTCIVTGKASETNKSAVICFNYNHASTLTQNTLGLGLFGNNNLLTIDGNGQVKIITNTASSSTTTGVLVVTGGIGTGAASYLTGPVHIVGAVGTNKSLIARGLQGCNASTGNTGTVTDDNNDTNDYTATDWGLYLNHAGGPVHIGSTSNDTLNANTNNLLKVYYTQDSLSIDTGAVVVDGGMGIGKRLYVGGPVMIGNTDIAADTGYATADSGGTNYIGFYGVNGDGPGTYNHTYIGESIYGAKDSANEKSELLIYHGNDPTTTAGIDRIRLFSAQVDIQVYTASMPYAAGAASWNDIRATAGTQVANFANGKVTITGNIVPEATNTRTLGTSSLKWNNIYATTFTGNLQGGNVTLGAEGIIYAPIKRKKAGNGGWAYSPLVWLDNADTDFAHIGVYGNADTLSYIYIGSNDYNGNNLRITSSGAVRIPVTTASTSKTTGALTVGGGAGFGGTVYANAFNGPLTGDVTGNTDTATTLQTARTLWGQSFDGSANITGDMTNVGPNFLLPSNAAHGFYFLTSSDGAANGYFGKIALNTSYAAANLTDYVLHVKGASYINGLLTIAGTSATHKGIKLGNIYLNAIDGRLILQDASEIRFTDGDDWDYDKWAGLKYDATNKIISLGIADGTVFTKNTTAQTDGTLQLINTRYLYMNTRPVLDIHTTLDNTAFNNVLRLFNNQNNESTTSGFDATKSSWGISFERQWNSVAADISASQAGIYAYGVTNWRAGLVFRVKSNTTKTNTHDISALILRHDGEAIFAKNVLISGDTASSSTDTGALIISGGVGIAKALYVGSNITVTGNVLPNTTNTYTLGSTSLRWKELYIESQSAGNSNGIIFYSGSSAYGRIGSNNTTGGLALYGSTHLWIRPSLTDMTKGFELTTTNLYPTTNDDLELGSTTSEWKNTYSKTFIVEQHVTMQWNSTDQSLDFIFA